MRVLRTAEIVAIGSELLTPHRLDTNSLFLTNRLNEFGIDVRMKAVVGDDAADLAAVLQEALARADLVITSGGLGPTTDDITRDVVAGILGLGLVEDETVLAKIRARFQRRGLKMPELNRRQALVPVGAEVCDNVNGTAPGLAMQAGDHLVVLLPGPPRELQPMFDACIAPRLEKLTAGRKLRRRVIKITGRAESQVDEIAAPIYTKLAEAPVPVRTTILATPGQIELHLAAEGDDVSVMDRALDEGVNRLAEALGVVVFSVDGRSLEAVVGDLLRERGLRIGVAESCTGGLVLGRLTDVPGSSAWVVGGVVAYSNDVKTRDLDVPEAMLAEHGAVSEPVARAMADGVRSRLGADVGLAITGIAGPSGGSAAKPIGTVVLAVSGISTEVRTVWFPGDRQMVRQFSVAAALDMVRRALHPAPHA